MEDYYPEEIPIIIQEYIELSNIKEEETIVSADEF